MFNTVKQFKNYEGKTDDNTVTIQFGWTFNIHRFLTQISFCLSECLMGQYQNLPTLYGLQFSLYQMIKDIIFKAGLKNVKKTEEEIQTKVLGQFDKIDVKLEIFKKHMAENNNNLNNPTIKTEGKLILKDLIEINTILWSEMHHHNLVQKQIISAKDIMQKDFR